MSWLSCTSPTIRALSSPATIPALIHEPLWSWPQPGTTMERIITQPGASKRPSCGRPTVRGTPRALLSASGTGLVATPGRGTSRISAAASASGGNAWESNPPRTLLTPDRRI